MFRQQLLQRNRFLSNMSDGDGGTYKEYGYYGATVEDMSGKVIMMDTPFMYFDDNEEHNWNNTLVLITGAYTQSIHSAGTPSLVAMLPELYLHKSEIYGVGNQPEHWSTNWSRTWLHLPGNGHLHQGLYIEPSRNDYKRYGLQVRHGTTTTTVRSSFTLRTQPSPTSRDTRH